MANKNILTPTDIRNILLSEFETNVALATRYGVSRNVIWGIRSGRTHSQLWPELDRVSARMSANIPLRQRSSCKKCVHWSDYCTLGIPESLDPSIGQHWAKKCVAFSPPATP